MKVIKQIKPGVVLKEVKPQIFLLKFKSNYEMCMSFLRYQESYESPSTKFRGKCFTIIDFMDWYSKKYGKGAFTYPRDWGGFNLPGRMILKLHQIGIKDYNHYDDMMREVHRLCSNRTDKFYLIGVSGKGEAFDHEMAHGLFYTKPDYRKEMKRLVKKLPAKIRKQLCEVLDKMGYAKKVHVDEIQAYLSTGVDKPFKNIKLGRLREEFICVFHYFNT